MKSLILFMVVISGSLSAKAVPDGPKIDCDKGLKQAQADPGKGAELDDVRAIASASGKDYGDLASRLCTLYSISGDIVSDSKDTIVNFIKTKEPDYPSPSTADIIRLLNKNKNYMICENGKNFINFAIEKGYYNEIVVALFGEELFSDDVLLDFNAITMTYNPTTKLEEPMTVLDYIEKVALLDPAISGDDTTAREITEIKDLIIEDFGAKNYSALTLAERAGFDRLTAGRW